MVVTLYRTDHTLWHGEYPVRWSTYRFAGPAPYSCLERRSGARLESSASVPVEVHAPVGCAVRGERLRVHLARHGLRGFRLADPADSRFPTPYSLAGGHRAS